MNGILKILVVSSEQGPFRNYLSDNKLEIRFCGGISEAIQLATEITYDYILIRLSEISGHIHTALKSLRQTLDSTPIILLCSMHEEPLCVHLIQQYPALRRLADNYLIYPFELDSWFQSKLFSAKSSCFPLLDDPAETIRRLEKLATEDDLTGLKNRRYIREFLYQILDYARHDQFHVTLLMFDIDNFKPYNDAFGHSTGDDVLCQVGEMIKACCRAHDVVARVGGDEFAVVFWDLPLELSGSAGQSERRKAVSEHPREPVFMAERFRRQLSMAKLPRLGAQGKGTLTISGGLASFPKDGSDVNGLFEKADQAMLAAKRMGKNRVVIVGSAADNVSNKST